MDGIETEGVKRSTSHLQQEERGSTKCLAGRRLRCGLRREMSADIKPSHRTARGRGVNS
jgi:hypothetical protein